MVRTTLLADDVWAQLAPQDARLGRSGRRQLALAAVAIAVVASLVACAQLSGLIVPRLSARSGDGSAGAHRFTQTVIVKNNGWFDEHISAIDSDARGAEVVRIDGAGAVLHPGASVTVRVNYRMLDCAEVRPGDSAPIHLRLHRPWGISTVTVKDRSDLGPWVACGHAPH